MSDEELLETYRAAINKAMDEAYARDGFATNMSRESIVAGLRAVFDMSKGETRAEWDAEQGDKPAPCVMTHTPPFDFAQCETHDETFPLGGACKWDGKESIAQVLQDEADALRMRAVRAEHQLEILRAELGEAEWEYGIGAEYEDRPGKFWRETEWDTTTELFEALGDLDDALPSFSNAVVIRRRPPTPWLPVPDTTNNESEGKA